jgi:peptidoglycan/xylan/chitin deacetylase (PgdA/CDA1 family)
MHVARLQSMARRGGRQFGCAVFRWTLVLPLLLRSKQPRQHAAILVYHNPRSPWFDRHLEFLERHQRLISMDVLVQAVTSHDWSEVPSKAVVVTLDDGHAGNRDHLRLFAQHDVQPTIFLCTQIVGTHRHFWWTHVAGSDRHLKRLPDAERFWQVLEQDHGFVRTREYGANRRQALSRSEIEELDGHVAFGSHGRFHALLPMCSRDEATEEICTSRSEVAAITGRPCSHFAYPNGDYGEREIELVKKAGYISARTTEVGWVSPRSDPYRLPIIAMPHEASLNELRAQLAGYNHLPTLARRVVNRFRRQRVIDHAVSESRP